MASYQRGLAAGVLLKGKSTVKTNKDEAETPTITVNIPLTNDHIRILKEFKATFWGVNYGACELSDVAAHIFNIALAFAPIIAEQNEQFLEMCSPASEIVTDSAKKFMMKKLLRNAKVRGNRPTHADLACRFN